MFIKAKTALLRGRHADRLRASGITGLLEKNPISSLPHSTAAPISAMSDLFRTVAAAMEGRFLGLRHCRMLVGKRNEFSNSGRGCAASAG